MIATANLIMPLLPLNPRATRMALIVASVPELTALVNSMEGMAAAIVSAKRHSVSVGAPKPKPRAAASCTAAMTVGWACPTINAPPRADIIHIASAVGVKKISAHCRVQKTTACRPPPRKARTGELTPPGMRRSLISNNRAEVFMCV